MPAATYYTWDGDPDNNVPPHRPSRDDVGGDQMEDDAEFPPDPTEMPTAAGHNQQAQQIPGLANVAPIFKLEVRFSGGTPAVYSVATPGSLIDLDTFTVTDNGNGDTTIEWAADTFPSPNAPPFVQLLSSTAPTGPRWSQVEVLTNGLRVRTYEGTTAADFDFGLAYG